MTSTIFFFLICIFLFFQLCATPFHHTIQFQRKKQGPLAGVHRNTLLYSPLPKHTPPKKHTPSLAFHRFWFVYRACSHRGCLAHSWSRPRVSLDEKK
ncbi:hypothetical protein BKA57DRAFT_446158 [Linnemannia elongata]|nr:hypothetical protein BKA57DRAFT_446158 [Linnemannia elongata]